MIGGWRAAVFLCSLVPFLCYLHGQYVRDRASREAASERSEATPRHQVSEEAIFYLSRLETLYSMLSESMIMERRAYDTLDNIREAARQAGADVFSVKTEEKAQRALYQAQRRRIAIENQIRTTKKAMAGR